MGVNYIDRTMAKDNNLTIIKITPKNTTEVVFSTPILLTTTETIINSITLDASYFPAITNSEGQPASINCEYMMCCVMSGRSATVNGPSFSWKITVNGVSKASSSNVTPGINVYYSACTNIKVSIGDVIEFRANNMFSAGGNIDFIGFSIVPTMFDFKYICLKDYSMYVADSPAIIATGLTPSKYSYNSLQIYFGNSSYGAAAYVGPQNTVSFSYFAPSPNSKMRPGDYMTSFNVNAHATYHPWYYTVAYPNSISYRKI